MALILSNEALAPDHELTVDETELFIDALKIIGEGEVDLSDQPEVAQNATAVRIISLPHRASP